MNTKKLSPYGQVHIRLENEVVNIEASTDLAAFWGQGFAAGKLRLWQLDLSRRVAGGELCEVLGKKARKTDVFQRKLGLRALAKREVERCAQVVLETGKEELQSLQVKAYVQGINAALDTIKILPFECLVLRYRPKPFTAEDVYIIAQLKYFINSAWQYEMFYTNVLKRIEPKLAKQLFTTFAEDGSELPPLNYRSKTERSLIAEKAFQDGLEGLRLLGLSSPDTGSNVFAVNGERSATGEALLAADPHMGQVNPSFSLLYHLKTEEGLNVFGANFPGVPGILIGRNDSAAWGMVGIMADNQDLSYAEINWEKGLVKENGQWVDLQTIQQPLKIKGQPNATITTYAFARGRLIQKEGNYGLFLRWPALDSPMGEITMYQMAKSKDWQSFKQGLSNVYNAPMMVGYADKQGNIGLHAIGLLPRRKVTKEGEHLGAILQNQDHPASPWEGYLNFEELPNVYNPPEGYIIYSNQYSEQLFGTKQAISNRWHPPTRALRIKELLEQMPKLTAKDMQAIQDDKVDLFARNEIGYLLSFLNEQTLLDKWQGDTSHVKANLLFERFIYALAYDICAKKMGKKVFALYTDFWPTHRWNVLTILRHHLSDWLNENDRKAFESDPKAFMENLVRTAFHKANVQVNELPIQVFQHSIKQPTLLAWLLTGRAKYKGGNRETIHAARQNVDFLTSSQTNFKDKKQKPFSFGPAFKFVSVLNDTPAIEYAINSTACGRPFFWALKNNLNNWQQGKRNKFFL